MKRIVFIIFILFNFVVKQQAQNLIQNGSFENYNNVANFNSGNGFFFDYSVIPEQRIVLNWDVYYSPDYFTTAYSYPCVPSNSFGNTYPKNGNAYCGIGTYLKHPTLDLQEYIYQDLVNPLKADTTYCMSFFVTYSDRAVIAIKNIGASFSNSIQATTSTGFINTVPQVSNNLVVLTDTINWVEIKGCFTAQGGERYVTIGNFNTNANTDTVHTKTTNPFPSGGLDISYYYIDSVSLWQNNFPTNINYLKIENSLIIYPNPTNSILNIRDKNQQLQNATIEIKNTLGQIAYFDVYTHQIDISHLPAGIYFITLNNKESKRTIKFVKD
ncbi:MAG: T9SS type A sorting domain-containing protein [Bacteroidia bacterium]|nr:T9SS type A sorting domain-containing protein [Bacteroidia bacterium]